MSEVPGGTTGESLGPDAIFLRQIDAHFDTVGGRGMPGRQWEELVHLAVTDGFGLPQFSPHIAWAVRPVPGHAELAAETWPDVHGYCVHAIAWPRRDASQERMIFMHEGNLWLRSVDTLWRGQVQHPLSSDKVQLDPESTQLFLGWLGRTQPVLSGESEKR